MTNDERLKSNARGYFRFEKLLVWMDSRELVKEVYKIASKFPKNEQFALVDQIKRSAVSISLNITEGSTRKSDKDFKRFLIMAQGSVNELVTAFYVALDLRFINDAIFDRIYESALKVNAKLNALIKSISR